MDTPNPELMHAYGTDVYYLEKVGAFKDVLRMAAPVAWMGMIASNQAEDARQRAEAEALNEAIRVAEANRMRPALQGFHGDVVPRPMGQEDYTDPYAAINSLGHYYGKYSSVNPELYKFAERFGRALARQEMAKEALFNRQPAPQAPVYGSGGRMRLPDFNTPAPQVPANYRTAATPSIPPPIPTPTGPISSIKDPRFQAAPGHVAGEGLSDFKTSPWAEAAPKLEQRAVKAGITPTFTPTPGASGAASSGAASAAKGAGPRVPTTGLGAPKVPGAGGSKPWVSGKTIGKGLGALGIAGLAYGGYRLLRGAKQKAEEPHTGGHAWGQTAPPLYSGVGAYGHPVY